MKIVMNKDEYDNFRILAETHNIKYSVTNTSTNSTLQWRDGPIITAMRLGAVLCLDEIDQARSSIMCLNTIAQGSAYYIKKTNELVKPSPGFTLIGTANTKGDGEGMDKFSGAQIMNEAFLERFSIIFEQDYPTRTIEEQILLKHIGDKNLIKHLLDITAQVRRSYKDGDLDFNLTTRRLVHITKNYAIFDDIVLAIDLAIARFSPDNQQIIRELYSALVKEEKVKDTRASRRSESFNTNSRTSTSIFDSALVTY